MHKKNISIWNRPLDDYLNIIIIRARTIIYIKVISFLKKLFY